MRKTILYFGNHLSKRLGYKTVNDLLAEKLSSEGYKVITYSGKANKYLRMADMLRGFFKHSGSAGYILIDTYSTANFYYALAVSQLARIFQKKYIPVLHGGNLPNRLDNSSFFSKLIFKNAYKNIAPSGYLKHEFEKRGFETTYIPNILEIKKYPFKERKNLRPRLLYVRAFAGHYNPALAVEVLHRLKKDYPAAVLCMVGPEKDDSINVVRESIKKYALEDSVILTGALSKEKWIELSRDYDIFINTTNVDNTPVSVMEAMALGLPVVSTNVGGIPFLVEDGKEGILVNPGDAVAFTEAIKKLLSNPDLASQLQRNARKKAETFDWETVKHQWFEILK
jgi:glycosyltransferase involved in cell wall biosynthesis